MSVSPKLPTSTPVGSRSTTSDRKSTRLNSSHSQISYAVFCLKKKKKKNQLSQPHPIPNLSYSYTTFSDIPRLDSILIQICTRKCRPHITFAMFTQRLAPQAV